MNDALIEQLSDRNYCLKELHMARDIFSTKPYTLEKFKAVEKTLGLMYLYCPDKLQNLVLSHIQEAEIRFLLCGGKRNE